MEMDNNYDANTTDYGAAETIGSYEQEGGAVPQERAEPYLDAADDFYQQEWARDQQAEQRFDSEIDRHLMRVKPGFPESCREAVSGMAWQLVLDNPGVYEALRSGGDTGGIEQAVTRALHVVDTIYQDWINHPAGASMKPAEPEKRNLEQLAADYLAAERDRMDGRPIRQVSRPQRERPPSLRRPFEAVRSSRPPGSRNLEDIAAEYYAGYAELLERGEGG